MTDSTAPTPDEIRAIWQRDPATWNDDEKRLLAATAYEGFSAMAQAVQAWINSMRPVYAKIAQTIQDVFTPRTSFRAYATPREWHQIAQHARRSGDDDYADAIYTELRRHKGRKWRALSLCLNSFTLRLIADQAGVKHLIIVGA